MHLQRDRLRSEDAPCLLSAGFRTDHPLGAAGWPDTTRQLIIRVGVLKAEIITIDPISKTGDSTGFESRGNVYIKYIMVNQAENVWRYMFSRRKLLTC